MKMEDIRFPFYFKYDGEVLRLDSIDGLAIEPYGEDLLRFGFYFETDGVYFTNKVDVSLVVTFAEVAAFELGLPLEKRVAKPEPEPETAEDLNAKAWRALVELLECRAKMYPKYYDVEEQLDAVKTLIGRGVPCPDAINLSHVVLAIEVKRGSLYVRLICDKRQLDEPIKIEKGNTKPEWILPFHLIDWATLTPIANKIETTNQ